MTEIVTGSLRMLGDRILLKPLDWDASKTLIAIRHGRPVRGEVKAVGPGCYPNRYQSGKRDGKDFRKSYATKGFRPTEVKVGDIVELGGLSTFDGAGYIFQEVLVGTELHLICSEKDVACVRDDCVRSTFGTRTLGGCGYCSQPIGSAHLERCEIATGEIAAYEQSLRNRDEARVA